MQGLRPNFSCIISNISPVPLFSSMYTDTRQISANAVKAGQAYQQIVDAIENANTAAQDAYDAADNATTSVCNSDLFQLDLHTV